MRVQRALQTSSCAKQLAGSLCRHSAFRSPHWASWVLVLCMTAAHGHPPALHNALRGQGGLRGREVWARDTKPHPDLKSPLHFVSTQPFLTFAHRRSLTSPKRFFPVLFSLRMNYKSYGKTEVRVPLQDPLPNFLDASI